MKTPRKPASSLPHLGFQIAPMVDVVFVIMLFFMVLASMVKKEGRLRLPLPGGHLSPNTPIVTPDEITVRVADDGQVYLNDDPVDNEAARQLPELAASLWALKRASDTAGSQLLVTLHADERATYQRITDCLDAMVRARISTITFLAVASE